MNKTFLKKVLSLLVLFSPMLFSLTSYAATAADSVLPNLALTLSGGETEQEGVSILLEILFVLTILSLAPAIVLMMTSFTRIIIVFSFLRQAMGIQQLPPTQVLASLAIFMTAIIMYPVGKQINDNALQPYLNQQINLVQALDLAQGPIRTFMFSHTREKDISLFYSIAQMDRPNTLDEVPTVMLVAAFMISELKTAFSIGFLIYIPFLIVDMCVSSILMAMGMMMLPPATISLPFKLLLFIVVDGWHLLIGEVIQTFR